MDDILYTTGPRFVNDVNLDADIIAVHPKIAYRNITDPVSDGSLGDYGYALGQKNLDGTDL